MADRDEAVSRIEAAEKAADEAEDAQKIDMHMVRLAGGGD